MYPGAEQAFKDEIKNLKSNYGEEHFGEAKVLVLWNELKEFSPKQIKSICAFVIKEHNYPPTVAVFHQFGEMLREKIRQHERETLRQDAKDFWEGTYHSDDVKMLVRTIKDRIDGKCDDKTWAEFQDFIKNHGEGSKPLKCKKCDDTGVYFDTGRRAVICRHESFIVSKSSLDKFKSKSVEMIQKGGMNEQKL